VQTSLAKKESLSFDKKRFFLNTNKKAPHLSNKAFPKPHLFQVNKHLTIG
jgi:hypothetical protein